MSRFAVRDAIQRLDPLRDDQRIVFLSSRCDFVFDTARAQEFALFRTFAVPSISALLDRTGEFRRRPEKRYTDTGRTFGELMHFGYDSAQGTLAIQRMNKVHGRFTIANDDLLYVLSSLIFELIRWNERFGWRRMVETERLGYFHFWRQVGIRMHIRDIPDDYAMFEHFNREYERQHHRFTASNQRVGAAIRDMIVRRQPRWAAPLVRNAVYATLDEPLLQAFGFPRAPRLLKWLMPKVLRLQSKFANARWEHGFPGTEPVTCKKSA